MCWSVSRALTGDAPGGRGKDLEALRGDGGSAVDAAAVGAVVDSCERVVDLAQLAPQGHFLGHELLARVQIGGDVSGMLRRRGVLPFVVDIAGENGGISRDLRPQLAAHTLETLLWCVHAPSVRSRTVPGEGPQDPDPMDVRHSRCRVATHSLKTPRR